MLDTKYLHCEIIQFWIENGEPPSIQWLLERTREPQDKLVTALKKLEEDRGGVVDPELHKKEISTISILDKPAVVTMQPFTTRLSNINITTSNKKGPCYSASCAFSALGSFMLVPEDTITINSSQSDGRGKVTVQFDRKKEKLSITPKEAIVHFPKPISVVMQDVKNGNDGIMFFKSSSHLSKWLSQQGTQLGRSIPVETGYKLAKMWFSSHHNINWRIWKSSEVNQMFALLDLSHDDFWLLQ